MQQLQSEPWVKSSPSLFHQGKVSSLYEELQDITPEELSSKANGFALSKRFVTRHQNVDIKDTANVLKTADKNGSKKLYEEINYQTCYREEEHLPSGILGGKYENSSLKQISFISNLSTIIKKRNLGANHYSSDSQLTTTVHPAAAEDSKSVIGKKKIVSSSHSLFSSSRGLLEKIRSVPMSRKNETFRERRGSGALLLDNTAQTRPGFLPPLNVNLQPQIPAINFLHKVSGVISYGQKHLIPAAPASLSETKNTKTLLRRQSLQTEQIKQLVNF